MQKRARWLLIAAGNLFVAVGVVGIFLPLLPTTPFLLLAAYCYLRSSPAHYERLMANPHFGRMLRDYHEGRGVTRRTRYVALSMLWASMGVSAWRVGHGPLLWVLLGSGVVGSYFILRLKTMSEPRGAGPGAEENKIGKVP